MKERIKKLRKELNLTQQEFAEKIKISRNNIATYETGKSNPSDGTINLICRTFHVNEEWLRSGVGEMFLPQEEFNLLDDPSLDNMDKEILKIYVSLPQDLRDALKEITKRFAAAFIEKPAPEKPDALSDEEWELIKKRRYEQHINIVEGGIDNKGGTIHF